MANTVGTMVGYNVGVDLKEKFLKCQELGINSCQVNIWNTAIFTSDEHAEMLCKMKSRLSLRCLFFHPQADALQQIRLRHLGKGVGIDGKEPGSQSC